MKKTLIGLIICATLILPGCVINKPNVIKDQPKRVAVWWGTKAEVIAFLNSPEAQANRWMVESLGE